MGCMSVLDENGRCRCGFDESAPTAEDDLPLRTVVAERYIVGRELSRDGEGISYIGFDIADEDKVIIKEFLPSNIAKRNALNGCVVPVQGKETELKILMSDFEDLFRGLSKLEKNEYIVPVESVVSDNGTVYAVSKYVRTISYGDYLQHNGGEFTWPQVKKLFMPLFTQLTNLHANGFIHRGLSPESIRVNARGKLLISGFGTSSLYFKGSDMDATLTPGYAAPEEYSGSNRQGAFTDVYSVAAVLYKTLTGTMPVPSDARMAGDELTPPHELESSVPESVSDAIMNAMTIDASYRLQSIDEFTAELLESAGSNTVMFSPKDVEEMEKSTAKKREAQKPEKKKKESGKVSEKGVQVRLPWGVIAGGVFFIILLVIVLAVLRSGMLGLGSGNEKSGVLKPDDPGTVESGIGDYQVVVPNFIGRMRENVEGNEQYSQFTLVFEEEMNQSYSEGMIFYQSVNYRTQVDEGTEIVLKVSTGPEKVPMPNLVGKTLEEAEATLNELGIVFQAVANYSGEYDFEIVYDQSVPEGEDVVTENTLTKVYLYYGAKQNTPVIVDHGYSEQDDKKVIVIGGH